MTLPVFRRFSMQDLPDAPDWVEQVIDPLNLFCETTVSSLNKNLTLGDNVQGMKYITSFITPADYATGGFNVIDFAYTGNGKPNCCDIGQISRRDDVKMLDPFSLNIWELSLSNNPFRVRVQYIAGLLPNIRYDVTLIVQ